MLLTLSGLVRQNSEIYCELVYVMTMVLVDRTAKSQGTCAHRSHLSGQSALLGELRNFFDKAVPPDLFIARYCDGKK